jgi:hypothetical protein
MDWTFTLQHKYAIIEKINSGAFALNTSNLPDTYLIFESLFKIGLNKVDWLAACDWLDTPEKTIRRWYLEKRFPAMATKLLIIKWRGFLPYSNKWKDCRFDKDENIVTPYGVCKPSDIAFIHRYKWQGQHANEQLKALKDNSTVSKQTALSNAVAIKMEELKALTEQITPHHNPNLVNTKYKL